MDASVELVKQCLSSVVYIHAEVPAAHPSTRILGDERMGTGTVIDPSGLILTVNYVVMGAETLQVSFAKGRTQRAWLGVFAHPLDEGVVVAGLVPNGPGARSGIQEGDVIVSLDARQVPTQRDLYLSLWRRGPGERIALEVMRDNELKRLDVTGG